MPVCFLFHPDPFPAQIWAWFASARTSSGRPRRVHSFSPGPLIIGGRTTLFSTPAAPPAPSPCGRHRHLLRQLVAVAAATTGQSVCRALVLPCGPVVGLERLLRPFPVLRPFPAPTPQSLRRPQ